MDPDKVLNEEERKKYTHPKKRPRLQNSRTSVTEASTSQSIIEPEPQETDEPELIIDEVDSSLHILPAMSIGISNFQELFRN